MNPKKQNKTHQKNPAVKETSWADRVKVTDASTRFTLDPIPPLAMGAKLEITEDMLTEHAEQWTRCMVGFFPGYRMNYQTVNTIATRVWKSSGLEAVMTTAAGFMIFRFKKEEQMLEILEKGPWLFGGKAIILQQWHPHFVFDKNKISKLPVWVRVFGLPFPLWSRKGLSLVASMIGKPLSCDEATFTCSRLDFARICVEIDASQPFKHNFDITTPLSTEPLHIEVEYEWKPVRCAQCQLFGHSCKPVDVAATKNGDIATVLAVEGACEGDGKGVDHRSKEMLSKGKDTAQATTSDTASGPVPTNPVIVAVDTNQKVVKPSITGKVGNDDSIEGTVPKQHKDKGKGIMVVVQEHQVVQIERDENIPKAVGRSTRDELQYCTVNTVASLQSQTSEDGDVSCGDSQMRLSSYDKRDTSPEAFTKVKKKKGGKKKGAEARGL
ncbi:ZINC KNUCKLE CX2CX4HX4C-RELATED [Salix viminalis]|uniref:ZINC KNUCKLE CX2CX4HX4C-RELATED n=1 Tax=Salix viminalis TaxID=40686 RepID=A0A9Q0SDN0_SALVM|nr:ZINC KNUCKLE CX2CX4HX4C-RELATED [Salix viminalis]